MERNQESPADEKGIATPGRAYSPIKRKTPFIVQLITGIVTGSVLFFVIYLGIVLYGFKTVGDNCNDKYVKAGNTSQIIRVNLDRIKLAGYTTSGPTVTVGGDCIDSARTASGSITFIGGTMTVDQLTQALTTTLKPQTDLYHINSIIQPSIRDTNGSYRYDKDNFNSIRLVSKTTNNPDRYIIDYHFDRNINCASITGKACNDKDQAAITTYRLNDLPIARVTISQGTDIK